MKTKTTIGNVCEIKTGKLDANASNDDGIYPFFTCSRDPLKINKYAFDLECVLLAGNGDLNVKYYKGKFNAYQRTYVIYTKENKKENLNTRYLYYFFLSYIDTLRRKSVGATIKYIKLGDIANASIGTPPLSEQERIVKQLDDAFAKIDALKENAKNNIKEVKAFFLATLSKELKHREGWIETKIGDFCEIVRGKRFVRADIVDEGVPCIHYGDIYTHYGMSATKAKGCVSSELAKKLRFANKNDVIVVAAGENKFDIGVGVAWFGDEPAVVHDACFILKHSQNPMFLSFYFRSTEYHQYLKDEVNEGKICSFLTKPLAEARISLPSIEEQRQIVKRLEIAYTNCKAIEESYYREIAQYDALKQSILRKTFE